MSTLSPSSANAKSEHFHASRPPKPTLFLGPPSRNTSNISLQNLHPAATTTSPSVTSSQPLRGPLPRSRSFRAPEPSALGRSRQHQEQQQQQQTEGDRTDALWAEMQATLAEVELSAATGNHVFGGTHSRALEELRTAQNALAQAWGRSEAEEEGVGAHKDDERGGDGAKEGGKGEEGEEDDIEVARKRREANEKYFWKVRSGVLDVVGKLEVVAGAMGRVEKESREMWSGSESLSTGSESATS